MLKLCQRNNNSYRSKCMKYMLTWPTVDSYSNYIRKNRALQCRLKNVNKYFQIFVLVKKYIRRIFKRRKVNIYMLNLIFLVFKAILDY